MTLCIALRAGRLALQLCAECVEETPRALLAVLRLVFSVEEGALLRVDQQRAVAVRRGRRARTHRLRLHRGRPIGPWPRSRTTRRTPARGPPRTCARRRRSHARRIACSSFPPLVVLFGEIVAEPIEAALPSRPPP